MIQRNERLKQTLADIRDRQISKARTTEEYYRIAKTTQATCAAYGAILEMLRTVGFSPLATETCDEILRAFAECHRESLTREEVAEYMSSRHIEGQPVPSQAVVNAYERQTGDFLQGIRTMVGQLLRDGQANFRQHAADVRQRN